MRKGRNGFTLLEMLGVIVLLAIFSLIVIPLVSKDIKKSRNQLYNKQINNFKLAAKNFIVDNYMARPDEGESIGITLNTLKNYKYISDGIKNTKTDELFDYNMRINIINNGGLDYIVCDGSVVCDTSIPLYLED